MKALRCSDCGLATAGAAKGCEFCGCPYLETEGNSASLRFVVIVFAAVSALAFSEVLLIHLIR